jgi:hypothetical protein
VSRADNLSNVMIWEPQTPGNLRDCSGYTVLTACVILRSASESDASEKSN